MWERTERAAVVALLLSTLGSLVGAPASAQPRLDPREAERAGKEGERLLAQHDAARAVVELQRAYGLSKNVKWLLPLGLAYAEAERPLDALDALGRYLKEVPALPDGKRREIGGKLQVMLDQVAAVVTVEASRHNAPVKVDGRVVGTTPIEAPLRLMPGQHEVVLVPAPTDPSSGARVVIDVRPGERKTVKLEPGPRSRFLDPQSQAPKEPARRAVAGVERSAPPPRGGEFDPRELHRKWWFWTGVGAVAVLAIGLGAGLGARRGGQTTGEMIPGAPDWAGGVIDARSGALLTVALAGGLP